MLDARPIDDDITGLLLAWGNGDESARNRLLPMVHDELRRVARRRLSRERGDHTLQPTALVNEAYLRLVDQSRIQWKNRAQFFGVAAEVMRRILVDYARKRLSSKRGGGAMQVALDDAGNAAASRASDIVALDDAMQALAAMDSRKSRLVELRFFGGLSIEEAAAELGVSPGTAMRDWTLAKAWLQREISRGSHGSGPVA